MLPYLKKFSLDLVMLVKQHNITIIPQKKPIKLSLLHENPYIYIYIYKMTHLVSLPKQWYVDIFSNVLGNNGILVCVFSDA